MPIYKSMTTYSIKSTNIPNKTTFTHLRDFQTSNPHFKLQTHQNQKSSLSLSLSSSLWKMSDTALTVLDGTQLRALDLTVVAQDDVALMTGAKLLELADSRISSALFGLSLPQTLKSSALKRIHLDDNDVVSSDQVSLKLKDYLIAIADQLSGNNFYKRIDFYISGSHMCIKKELVLWSRSIFGHVHVSICWYMNM